MLSSFLLIMKNLRELHSRRWWECPSRCTWSNFLVAIRYTMLFIRIYFIRISKMKWEKKLRIFW